MQAFTMIKVVTYDICDEWQKEWDNKVPTKKY